MACSIIDYTYLSLSMKLLMHGSKEGKDPYEISIIMPKCFVLPPAVKSFPKWYGTCILDQNWGLKKSQKFWARISKIQGEKVVVHPHPSICRSNPLTIGKFPRTLKEAILEVLLILLGGGPCDYCVAPVQRIGILDFLDLGLNWSHPKIRIQTLLDVLGT